jgi:GT2 family glycosyltransferase
VPVGHRPDDDLSVSLCIISHNRPDDLARAVASSRGQGFDQIIVVDMASDPPLPRLPDVVHERSEVNDGVPAGRNRAAALARSDVLLFLDDDAVFLRDDVVDVVRNAFARDDRLGAIAGRILRADGSTVSSEHPFRGSATPRSRPGRGRAEVPADQDRPCAYVVGAVHAVRRVAWAQAGGLDARFFYSTEEVDLSFTLARLGWDLRYYPDLEIEHRPSPRGRVSDPSLPALRWRNRLVLVRRHLPVPIAIVHTLAWAARTWREATAAGDHGPWWDATRAGLTMPARRDPLSYRQLLELHRRGGRVLY